MVLASETEKELWRQAAIAAIKSVEDCKPSEHREAMQYACLVADGIVRSYRKRCGEDEDAKV